MIMIILMPTATGTESPIHGGLHFYRFRAIPEFAFN